MNFEKLNEDLYFKSSHYKFAKKPTDFDKGYLKVSEWVNELCFFYIQKSKQIEEMNEEEFKAMVQVQRKKAEALAPSLYRDGLLKALNDVG